MREVICGMTEFDAGSGIASVRVVAGQTAVFATPASWLEIIKGRCGNYCVCGIP